MKNRTNLVVLASGSGTNFQAILDACGSGGLHAQVSALAVNKMCNAIRRADAAGVPVLFHPWGPYKHAGKLRSTYDRDLAAKVSLYHPDLVILAGWMRLLSMSFLEYFPMRVVNLHPALPGAFPGTDAIARAFKAHQNGEIAHTGVMVHFVPDEGVDDGPVIAQEVVPILPEDTLEALTERLHATEHRLLVDAIRSLISDP